ncbi:hypothetical protein LFML04_0406 [Leptospirillum ferriphilum ML-04]|uniref:Uncharacterized protein n=1 Tax=Leptospirillum ferriphilum (strain ML-04) TaxID=1048260 RepID=J9Z9Q2_LEPFM|nr:hypothetical protein LFML04_0406 [Leptospirillum ferriphilum ML-04]
MLGIRRVLQGGEKAARRVKRLLTVRKRSSGENKIIFLNRPFYPTSNPVQQPLPNL